MDERGDDDDYDQMIEDSEEDINNKDMQNYRGYFVDEANEEEEEIKYYENGAHFPYDYLYQALEILSCEEPSQNNSIIHVDHTKPEEDYDHNFINYPQQNHRSRNQHHYHHINQQQQQHKGMSVYPVHKLNIDSHPKELKENIPHPVVVPSKTDQKNMSALYTTFGSKMKGEKGNIIFAKTRNKDDKPIMMKTIQITHSITKHKGLMNYNNKTNINSNKERKIKTRELSASSHQKVLNKTSKTITKPLVSNHNIISTSNKSLPKAINNIHINYKINHRNNPNIPKTLEPQNTRIIKPQLPKKTISKEKNQTKTKITTNHPDFFHLSINKHTSVEKTIKLQVRKSLNQNGEITGEVCINNPKQVNSISDPQKICLVSHHKSRNVQGDINSVSKSKTINQTENENNFLTQTTINNNLLTQMKTVNLDNSKNNPINLLQTTTKLINQSQLNKKKIICNANVDTKKIKNYLNIKLNLNPKGTSDSLANQIRKSFGIKPITSTTTKTIKPTMKSSSTSKPLKNSKPQSKTKTICYETNIDPNSPSKGSTNIPGSSSSTTTHKQSTAIIPKSSSIIKGKN